MFASIELELFISTKRIRLGSWMESRYKSSWRFATTQRRAVWVSPISERNRTFPYWRTPMRNLPSHSQSRYLYQLRRNCTLMLLSYPVMAVLPQGGSSFSPIVWAFYSSHYIVGLAHQCLPVNKNSSILYSAQTTRHLSEIRKNDTDNLRNRVIRPPVSFGSVRWLALKHGRTSTHVISLLWGTCCCVPLWQESNLTLFSKKLFSSSFLDVALIVTPKRRFFTAPLSWEAQVFAQHYTCNKVSDKQRFSFVTGGRILLQEMCFKLHSDGSKFRQECRIRIYNMCHLRYRN